MNPRYDNGDDEQNNSKIDPILTPGVQDQVFGKLRENIVTVSPDKTEKPTRSGNITWADSASRGHLMGI